MKSICEGIKIVDRSGLILDIFAKNARTKESRTQVELAQLNYLYPRLTRQWSHLSRQVGGIGVRGPGETQLEVDRRLVRKRIALLTEELKKISQQRQIRRRHRGDIFKAALVGYTNVGKSTLLNSLTNADTAVEDRLFATLDATIRATELSDHRRVLLIDTVGFIRKLPHHLVASFKSTLEEASEADLLLHIIDITHPNYAEQMETVQSVLKDLKLDQKPILNVFNKIDKLEDPALMAKLKATLEPCVFISAHRGIFLKEFKNRIKEFIENLSQNIRLVIPIQESGLISQLYDLAEVTKVEYEDSVAVLELKATQANAHRIKRLTNGHEVDVIENAVL